MSIRTIVVSAGLAVTVGSASAQPYVKPIFSSVAGAPSNTVPTLGGGWSLSTTLEVMDRPALSPDGTRWAITGAADQATTGDRVLVSGSGTDRTGAVLVTRESNATLFDGARNYFSISERISVRNNGDILFNADLDGATADDEVLVVASADGLSQTLAFRENQAEPTGTFANNFIGSTIDSPTLLADGTVAYKTVFDGLGTAVPVAPLTANNNDVLMIGNTILAREGATPVGTGAANWDAFDADTFFISTDGTKWLAQGDDEGGTTADKVLVYNGEVVLREGQTINSTPPGTIFATVSDDAFLSHNGLHYITNGSLVTPSGGTAANVEDWVIVDGQIVATTDDDITPNNNSDTPELWDDTITVTTTYFQSAINGNGDYVIGGVTNNANTLTNVVMVLNGERVLVREGDMVDINEDGLMNDDAFISIFSDNDHALTDDGLYYFSAELINGAGTFLGEAFLVVGTTPSTPCPSDFNGDTFVDDADFVVFAAAYEAFTIPPADPAADLNSDGFVDDADFVIFAAAYEAFVCP